jgi:hypothetical protein
MMPGEWHYIVLSRDSNNNIFCAVDGVWSENVYTTSQRFYNANKPICIGGVAAAVGPEYINGYIDEVRLTRSACRYQPGFTVPAAAFDDLDVDPLADKVRMLLHFDGQESPTDGSTIIKEERGAQVVTVGNAQLDTTLKKFGDAALQQDGTGDWITVYDSFPVPTALVSDAADSPSDQYYDSTPLITHFNAVESPNVGSEIFPNTGTAGGYIGKPIHLTDLHSKFGSTSAYFKAWRALRVASDSDFDFGSGDFTIDCWVRAPLFGFNGIGTYNGICGKRANSGSYAPYLIYVGGEGKVGCALSTTGSSWAVNTTSSNVVVEPNTWTHIALVRNGTSLKLYANGTAAIDTTISGALMTNSEPFSIGATATDGVNQLLYGYIDELCVLKGTARWTTDFTPPTAPYDHGSPGDTYLSSISLLLHFEGIAGDHKFADSSTKGKTVTLYDGSNGASISATTKLGGGSVNFDGTDDLVYIINQVPLQETEHDDSDPHFDKVTCLLHFNGSDASTTIIDDAYMQGSPTRTWTASGNAQLDTAYKRLGSASLLCDGTTDYISTPSDSGLRLASIDVPVFDVPTGPFPDDSSSPNDDPHWDKVVCLLHFNGTESPTDGSQVFKDEKGNYFAAVGNAQIDTAQSKWGGASLLVDGTTDSCAATYHLNGCDLADEDFTIEFWVRLNTTSGSGDLISHRRLGGNHANGGWLIAWTNNYVAFYASTDNFNWDVASDLRLGNNLTTGTWYHMAVVREGFQLRTYCDGKMTACIFTEKVISHDPVTRLGIGGEQAGNWCFNGWIDEFRLTKGVARYPGAEDFTVELWFRPNVATGNHRIIGSSTSTGYDGWLFYQNGSTIEFYATSNASSSWDVANARIVEQSIVAGCWYHLAVCREGGVWRTFCNGFPRDSWANGYALKYSSSTFVIGAGTDSGAQSVNGWIDEVRITKGLARYRAPYDIVWGDFTIDLWGYPDVVTGNHMWCGQWDGVNNTGWLVQQETSTLKFYATAQVGSWSITTNSGWTITSLSASTWYHVRVVRKGWYFETYVNGKLATRVRSSATIMQRYTHNLTVGASSSPNYYMDGKIEGFSLSKIAREVGPNPLDSYHAEDWTIEGWIYLDVNDNYATLLEARATSSLQNLTFGVYDTGGGARRLDMVKQSERLTGLTPVPTGEWVHMCAMRHNDILRLYVNGKGDKGLLWRYPLYSNKGTEMRIGAIIDSGGDSFDGSIDEFRITMGAARYDPNCPIQSAPWVNHG